MLNIEAIPAFEDNYVWLIHNKIQAVVVDPGDAFPVLQALDSNKLTLTAILLTHHHADHVGGVPELLKRFKVPVFGPANEHIPFITHPVAEGRTVTIPEIGLNLSIIDVPGHTQGHIAYVVHDQHWLFCGDTLFAGGCGRLFEGTPTQMVDSLAKIAALPDNTEVYCAHEYTLSNLRFAHEVDPFNTSLNDRIVAEKARRNIGKPTIPSTLGLEKATNPFLRCEEEHILDRLLKDKRILAKNKIAAFTALREWKNNFR